MEYSVLVIICMLILSAFFSGMEIAYVSSNKVHLAIEKKQKGFISLILQFSQYRTKLILIGNF